LLVSGFGITKDNEGSEYAAFFLGSKAAVDDLRAWEITSPIA
jgi:hypothetical protein